MSNNFQPVTGIIGSGVVGGALGRALSKRGSKVVFFDVGEKQIEALKQEGFDATLDISEIAQKANVFFICVPTPQGNDRRIDLSYLKKAVKNLAAACKSKDSYFLVVPKSTIVPTTTENLVLPLFEEHSGKVAGKDFDVAFNPEFLREKFAFEDTFAPDRIVIGSRSKKALEILAGLYSGFGCPIVQTDPVTAEMIKYTNNTFYATKISFFNEIERICDELDVDSQLVRKVVQMDRFHPQHPWAHGTAFGGKCLPKDINALVSFSKDELDVHPKLLQAVIDVNEELAYQESQTKSKARAKQSIDSVSSESPVVELSA